MRTGIAALGLAALTACGTTVPLAEQRAPLGDGLGGPSGAAVVSQDPGSTGTTGVAQQGDSAAPSATDGLVTTPTTGTATNAPSVEAVASAVPAVPAGTLARGVTSTSVRLGYMYFPSAPLAVLGSTDGDQSFLPGVYAALAKDVNEQGGVLGKKIELEGYPLEASPSNTKAETEEAPCNHFTVDKPVFAVLWMYFGDTLTPCLNRKGVAHVGGIYGAPSYADGEILRKNAFYVPGAALSDDYVKVFVARLQAQGWFEGWNTTTGRPAKTSAVIGMINFTDPALARFGVLLRKALSDAGHPVDDSNVVTYPGDLTNQATGASNAVLRMRANGVTHLIGNAVGGLLLDNLKNQGYFPRLAWDTNASFAKATANDEATVNMLRGVLGVGTIPAKDMASWTPVSPLQTRCEKVMDKAGIEWRSTRDRHFNVLHTCENFWSLVAAMKKGGELSPAGLRRGFDTLGPVQSALTFGAQWSPTRHASANVVADVHYVESCTCFRYTGTKTRF